MNGLLYDLAERLAERAGMAEHRGAALGSLAGEILEIGAGTGANLPYYERADRVVAVEPDPSMARRLRRRAFAGRVPVEVIDASAEALPFPDESFDHAVGTLVLCSIPDPTAALGEVVRVLRPGGTFRFVEHVRGEGSVGRWQDRLTPLHRRLAGGCHLNRDTAAEIERSGLRIDRLDRTTIPGHPLARPAIEGLATKP